MQSICEKCQRIQQTNNQSKFSNIPPIDSTYRLEVGHGNGPAEALGGQPQDVGDLGPVPKVMMKVVGDGQSDFGARGDAVRFKVREGWGVGCHDDCLIT